MHHTEQAWILHQQPLYSSQQATSASKSTISTPRPDDRRALVPTVLLLLSFLVIIRTFFQGSSPLAYIQSMDNLQRRVVDPMSQTALKPLANLLSWTIDLIEVVMSALGFLFNPIVNGVYTIMQGLTSLVRFALSGNLLSVIAKVPYLILGGLKHIGQVLAALFSSLGAGLLILSARILGGIGNFVMALVGVPILSKVDAMDARLHIPLSPSFIPASGIKLKSSFGLKQMYGRRWTLHAGRWNCLLAKWDQVLMESQLARYQAQFPHSAQKARFGFPKLVNGPAPAVVGSVIFFGLCYVAYRSSVRASLWITGLHKDAYGKSDWSPITRIDEETEEGKGTEEDTDTGE